MWNSTSFYLTISKSESAVVVLIGNEEIDGGVPVLFARFVSADQSDNAVEAVGGADIKESATLWPASTDLVPVNLALLPCLQVVRIHMHAYSFTVGVLPQLNCTRNIHKQSHLQTLHALPHSYRITRLQFEQ